MGPLNCVTGWAVQPVLKSSWGVRNIYTRCCCAEFVCLSVCHTPAHMKPTSWLLWCAALAQAGFYFRGRRPHNPASVICSIKYWLIRCPSAAFLTVLVLKVVWAHPQVNRNRRKPGTGMHIVNKCSAEIKRDGIHKKSQPPVRWYFLLQLPRCPWTRLRRSFYWYKPWTPLCSHFSPSLAG